MFKTSAALAFLFIAAASTASAQGIVIPNEPDLPPLGIERYAVRTEIGRASCRERVSLNV